MPVSTQHDFYQEWPTTLSKHGYQGIMVGFSLLDISSSFAAFSFSSTNASSAPESRMLLPRPKIDTNSIPDPTNNKIVQSKAKRCSELTAMSACLLAEHPRSILGGANSGRPIAVSNFACACATPITPAAK
jgi:hypothetical protein